MRPPTPESVLLVLFACGLAAILISHSRWLVGSVLGGDSLLSLVTLYTVGVGAALLVFINPSFFHDDQFRTDIETTIPSADAMLLSQLVTSAQLLLAALGLLSFLTRPRSRRETWLVAILIYGIISALSAFLSGVADTKYFLLGGLVLAATSCYAVPLDVVHRHLVGITQLVCTGSLLMWWLRYEDSILVQSRGPRFLDAEQLAGLAPDPNALAGIGSLALVFALYSSTMPARLALSIAPMGVLVLAQSRAGWMAALVGILVWTHGRQSRWLVRGVFLVGVPIMLILFESTFNSSGLTGRDTIWNLAWSSFVRSPIIGGGPTVLIDLVAGTRLEWAGQAHNQVLDTLAKYGLAGTIFLLLFVFSAVRSALVRVRCDESLPMAVLAAFLVRALVDSPVTAAFPLLAVVALLATAPGGTSRGDLNGPRRSTWAEAFLTLPRRPGW